MKIYKEYPYPPDTRAFHVGTEGIFVGTFKDYAKYISVNFKNKGRKLNYSYLPDNEKLKIKLVLMQKAFRKSSTRS